MVVYKSPCMKERQKERNVKNVNFINEYFPHLAIKKKYLLILTFLRLVYESL
uniref:Uncharacterized protein n=1 Tax=Octopus bimaculoides TaxID=37653 RepID=A0A0L8G810_OCTBM